MAGCVTTLHGNAAPGAGVDIAMSEGANGNGGGSQMLQDCTVALSNAKGFLESWKALATAGTPPTAEERDTLAAEVQGYIDQLNAQLPTITDSGLVSHVQSIVAEMNTIVLGLESGIAVELASYRVAVNSTTEYCQ